MIQKFLVKALLFPFSLLYGLGISLRDLFYRKGLLKAIAFDLPTIAVGNLSIGGAGKTPHIEYLVRLLKDYLHVATLSRGYQRKTRGYLEVTHQHTAELVGDEPLQFRRKFPEIVVTVSESRTFAIPEILGKYPQVQVILLDDAFQHRSIEPGLNILLTEFSAPYTRDFLLPSGRLREWKSGYRRADVIVVSKCPPVISETQRTEMIKELQPFAHQKVFFSYYDYLQPYYILNAGYKLTMEEDLDVLLICAIARTDYLVEYLETKVRSVEVLEYEDHHFFSKHDIGHLQKTFEEIDSKKKVIITTEKDAMRLELHHQFLQENKLPIFAIPVEVAFHFEQGPEFDEMTKQFLLDFRS